MKMTGAQIICEGLVKEGVEVIFGILGGAILPLYDTLPKYPQLRHILVRIPAHPIPVALADSLGMPIVGTSANLRGKPSALTADEVYSQFGDKIEQFLPLPNHSQIAIVHNSYLHCQSFLNY
ncbi:unnamed protein product, partial [marine sediment metagenome]